MVVATKKSKPVWKLMRNIIRLSESDEWKIAREEWGLYEIFQSEEPSECLCGKNPIYEICVLKNRLNGNQCVVGNFCVRKFLGLNSDKIFQAVSRIEKDNSKSINQETIDYCSEKCWINSWEKSFYQDTLKKRSLSERQRDKRQQINDKILRCFSRGSYTEYEDD